MATLEPTKGLSKITAKQVIAARRLKVAHPEMSMQAIKDKLDLQISLVMVGRAIRGITHSHLDMCGLEVRPMVTRTAEVEAPAPKRVRKTVKVVAKKPRAKKAPAVEVAAA
jgi:hypothetical protein